MIRRAGAAGIHIDVCDGHFAPGITVGAPVIVSLRRATSLALDVHLRVERSERFVGEFIEAGADRLAVHAETTPDLSGVVRTIQAKGAQAGAALNPGTPLAAVEEVLADLDFLLLASSDEEEIKLPDCVRRVREACEVRQRRRAGCAVQVEGGIDPEETAELIAAGADALVVGANVFGREDSEGRLRDLVQRAAEAKGNVVVAGSHRRE